MLSRTVSIWLRTGVVAMPVGSKGRVPNEVARRKRMKVFHAGEPSQRPPPGASREDEWVDECRPGHGSSIVPTNVPLRVLRISMKIGAGWRDQPRLAPLGTR